MDSNVSKLHASKIYYVCNPFSTLNSCIPLNTSQVLILALDIQRKQSNVPSISSLVEHKERMRPGHLLGTVSLQCFDTVGWMTRTSGP